MVSEASNREEVAARRWPEAGEWRGFMQYLEFRIADSKRGTVEQCSHSIKVTCQKTMGAKDKLNARQDSIGGWRRGPCPSVEHHECMR